MKLFRYIVFVCLSALALSGCKESGMGVDGDMGAVQFGVNTDPRADLYSVSTKSVEADPVYSLKIFKGSKEVAFYEDYTKIEKLTLAAGKYKFVVEGGKDNAVAIDEPYFKGEQDVFIVAGQTADVVITAKLANVRLSVEMSQIIKDNFKDYSFTVRGLELTKTMIEQGKSLFVSAEITEFNWMLKVVNNQDSESAFGRSVTNVVPRSHYHFRFDVDNSAGLEDGSAILNLTVDNSLTLIEEDINISLEKKEIPSFVYDNSSIVLGQQVVVNEIKRGANFKVNIKTVAGLKELKVRHASEALDLMDVERMFFPSSAPLEQAQKLHDKGIDWSALGGTMSSSIDFSVLANSAALGEYRFYITVVDNENQSVDCVVDFVVLPDQDHITKPAVYGAKYADFNGEWCTLEVPDGLTFQYRSENEEQWSEVAPENIVMGKGKAFSARVKGLIPLTKYFVRTYAPSSQKQGQEVDFTTFDAPEIPNMSFEESYWSGGYWYPNASGGNSYWATGNDGVVAGPVSMSANNYSTDDAVKGKAIYMKSVPITFSLSPVKFAAGSLFTGSYKTDMGTPKNSPKFGRPYRGRPLALKGWFKYQPQAINNDKSGVAGDQWGKTDKCHIYISLENWSGATSRPGSPRVVGYGEFKTDETITQYREFYIPIDYKDQTSIPTHVVLAATASHLGGDFCGGNGSEIWIDEFELVWE